MLRLAFLLLFNLPAASALAQCVGGVCIAPAGTAPWSPIRAPQFEPEFNAAISHLLAISTVRIVNQQGPARSLGSGTIVASGDSSALVLTCGHLFREGIGRATVLRGGTPLAARVLGIDPAWDIAVLQISHSSAPTIPLATSPPRVGESLTFGGYGPHGRLAWGGGRLVGYVQMQSTPTADTLQLTGAARQGDSGGPIVNMRGEVVGLVVGTDGRIVIGPSCRPIARFLARFRSLLGEGTGDREPGRRPVGNGLRAVPPAEPGNDNLRSPKGESPPRKQSVPTEPALPKPASGFPIPQPENSNLKSAILSALLPVLLAALGISVPPTSVFVALRVAACIARRRIRRRRRNCKSQKTNHDQMPNQQISTACTPRRVELERHLNDDYARELANVFAYGGQSPLQDATLGREFTREIDRAASSSDAKLAEWARDLRDRVMRRFHRIHGWHPSPAEPTD